MNSLTCLTGSAVVPLSDGSVSELCCNLPCPVTALISSMVTTFNLSLIIPSHLHEHTCLPWNYHAK